MQVLKGVWTWGASAGALAPRGPGLSASYPTRPGPRRPWSPLPSLLLTPSEPPPDCPCASSRVQRLWSLQVVSEPPPSSPHQPPGFHGLREGRTVRACALTPPREPGPASCLHLPCLMPRLTFPPASGTCAGWAAPRSDCGTVPLGGDKVGGEGQEKQLGPGRASLPGSCGWKDLQGRGCKHTCGQ